MKFGFLPVAYLLLRTDYSAEDSPHMSLASKLGRVIQLPPEYVDDATPEAMSIRTTFSTFFETSPN